MNTPRRNASISRRALSRLGSALALALCALTPAAAAQSTLAEGTLVVVTQAGLFMVTDGQQATQVLPTAAFGGGAVEAPSVTWIEGTDTFFVTRRNATGAGGLWRVQLSPGGTASVEDLTPALPAELGRDFRDADYSIGLDVLFVLEASTAQVLALAAPETTSGADAVAWSQLGQHDGVALAVRGAKHPFSVLVVTAAGAVVAARPSGVTIMNIKHNPSWTQIATDAVTGAYFLASKSQDKVVIGAEDPVSDIPMPLIDMNAWKFCGPLAQFPLDIEWDGREARAVAMAGDFLLGCAFGAPGLNHLIRLPIVADGPPQYAPVLLTSPAGSGIAGPRGDLALVRHDLPDITWFGSGGSGTGTSAPVFGGGGQTSAMRIGQAGGVDVAGAPPSAPAFLVIGALPLYAPLQGQVLGPLPQLSVSAATDAAGKCVLPLAIPPLQALSGLRLYLQWWIADTTTPAASDLVSSQLGIFTIGTP